MIIASLPAIRPLLQKVRDSVGSYTTQKFTLLRSRWSNSISKQQAQPHNDDAAENRAAHYDLVHPRSESEDKLVPMENLGISKRTDVDIEFDRRTLGDLGTTSNAFPQTSV